MAVLPKKYRKKKIYEVEANGQMYQLCEEDCTNKAIANHERELRAERRRYREFRQAFEHSHRLGNHEQAGYNTAQMGDARNNVMYLEGLVKAAKELAASLIQKQKQEGDHRA